MKKTKSELLMENLTLQELLDELEHYPGEIQDTLVRMVWDRDAQIVGLGAVIAGLKNRLGGQQ